MAKSSTLLNEYGKTRQDLEKNSKNSNMSSSTLSLHICAYENSFDATGVDKNVNSPDVRQQKGFGEKTKIFKNILTSSPVLEMFEIPRQMENNSVSKPEIMNFKASQKLLNPNETNYDEKKQGATSQAKRSSSSTTSVNFDEPAEKRRNIGHDSSVPISSNATKNESVQDFFLNANKRLTQMATTQKSTTSNNKLKTSSHLQKNPPHTPVTGSIINDTPTFTEECQTDVNQQDLEEWKKAFEERTKLKDKLQRVYDDKRNLQLRFNRLAKKKTNFNRTNKFHIVTMKIDLCIKFVLY